MKNVQKNESGDETGAVFDGAPGLSYIYERNGDLEEAKIFAGDVRNENSYRYTRDGSGRVVERTYAGSTENIYSYQVGYDSEGRPESIVYAGRQDDPRSFAFEYSEDNLLVFKLKDKLKELFAVIPRHLTEKLVEEEKAGK